MDALIYNSQKFACLILHALFSFSVWLILLVDILSYNNIVPEKMGLRIIKEITMQRNTWASCERILLTLHSKQICFHH